MSEAIKIKNRYKPVTAEIARLSCDLYQFGKKLQFFGWPLGDCPEIQGLVFGRSTEITGWEKDRSNGISSGRILSGYLGMERQASTAQVVQALVHAFASREVTVIQKQSFCPVSGRYQSFLHFSTQIYSSTSVGGGGTMWISTFLLDLRNLSPRSWGQDPKFVLWQIVTPSLGQIFTWNGV